MYYVITWCCYVATTPCYVFTSYYNTTITPYYVFVRYCLVAITQYYVFAWCCYIVRNSITLLYLWYCYTTITLNYVITLHVILSLSDHYFLYLSIVRRTVTCLSMISKSSWLVLQYLIRYTCMEDVALCKGKHTLYTRYRFRSRFFSKNPR